jgi:energy-coupling factor transporter ATP-binding protein EcfA2
MMRAKSKRSSTASEVRPEPPSGVPFPGLRPFREDEADRFCGREEQREAMLVKLESKRFLAVIGSSGCGKSSLVFAGLLPDIRAGNLFGVPADCVIASCRPGLNPFQSLADALMQTQLAGQTGWLSSDAAERTLRSGDGGLAKVAAHATAFLTHQHERNNSTGPAEAPPAFLIVVDQFEELFRFAELKEEEFLKQIEDRAKVDGATRAAPLDSPRDEALAFVALLLAAVRGDAPVHVVITMRSDYLGDCAIFPGLPAAISDQQFLVPRVTREQRAAAIEEPLMLFGVKPEDGLASRVINELGEVEDMLPLLQHALGRAWHQALLRSENALPETLTHDDYKRGGTVFGALEQHGEVLLAETKLICPELTDRHIARFFRCLLQWDQAGRLIRRPVMLKDLVKESGLTAKEAETIVNIFRSEGDNLLMPPPQEDLDEGKIIDVSHESLLRRWPRAEGRNGWRDEERSWSTVLERLRDVPCTAEPPAWLVGRAKSLYGTPLPADDWPSRYQYSWKELRDAIGRRERHDTKRRIQVWGAIAGFVLLWGWYSVELRAKNDKLAEAENTLKETNEKLAQANDKLTKAAESTVQDLRIASIKSEQLVASYQQVVQYAIQNSPVGTAEQLQTKVDQLHTAAVFNSPVQSTAGALGEPAAPPVVWPAPAVLPDQRATVCQFLPAGAAWCFVNGQNTLTALLSDGTTAADPFEFDAKLIAASQDGRFVAALDGGRRALIIPCADSVRVTPPVQIDDTLLLDDKGQKLTLDGFFHFLAAKFAVDEDALRRRNPELKLEAGAFINVPRSITRAPPQIVDLGEGVEATALAWHGTNSIIIGTSTGRLMTLKQQTGGDAWKTTLSADSGHDGALTRLLITTDKRHMLTVGRSTDIRLWRSVPPIAVWKLPADGRMGVPPVFSADGRWLLREGPKTLLSLRPLEPPAGDAEILFEHSALRALSGLALSGDGRSLALLHRTGDVSLASFTRMTEAPMTSDIVRTSDSLITPAGSPRAGIGARSLAWSPDSRLLVAGDATGRVRTWEVTGEQASPLTEWSGIRGAVRALSISQNSATIGGVTEAGEVILLPARLMLQGTWRPYFKPEPPPDEELALLSDQDVASPEFSPLFRAMPPGKTGVAWRLDDDKAMFVSARWDYGLLPGADLKRTKVKVRKLGSTRWIEAQPVDYGAATAPEDAERAGVPRNPVAALSTALAKALELKPDDQIELLLPQARVPTGGARVMKK